MMKLQKVVKLSICQCSFIVVWSLPASVERFFAKSTNMIVSQKVAEQPLRQRKIVMLPYAPTAVERFFTKSANMMAVW